MQNYGIASTHTKTYHFTLLDLVITECDIAVEMDLIVVPDELEHGNMEPAGKRDTILSHTNGVVFDIGTAETTTSVC